jgi:hypothetical protein
MATREKSGLDVGSDQEGAKGWYSRTEFLDIKAPNERACLASLLSPPRRNLELKSHLMVVWVPDTNISNIEYSGIEQPDLIIKSLEGFVPEEWGLKPYAGTTSGS